MSKRKLLVISTFLLAFFFISIGTIAYFRRIVNGNITGNAGNLVLIVNEADSAKSETFTIVLQRSEEEQFIMPDDRGTFDLNIDSTGSSTDVGVSITLSRLNLPNNLKFYLDNNYKNEITTYATIIPKSDDMTKTVPIYWFWDGSVDDINDTDFINQEISATVNVSATTTKNLYETLSNMDATLDTNIIFDQPSNGTNGQGLMMMNSTQNNDYPIIYYRGDVANNNVIFAGYCWLIVRTTETGGTKIIYNGKINSNGSCNNYSNVTTTTVYNQAYEKAYINEIEYAYAYSENKKSPIYVGYMYNDANLYFSDNRPDASGYIEHLNDNSIDPLTGRHTQNLKDSNAKAVIDEWYENNLLNYAASLEDTIWCNDRSVTSENNSIEQYKNNRFPYSAKTRVYENNPVVPVLTCSRDMDNFTVDSTNGNGDLDYPIGLLTVDEILITGIGENIINYLSVPNGETLTMSPYDLFFGSSYLFTFKNGNFRSEPSGFAGAMIRPLVSLTNTTHLISGNGSFEKPYIVS